MILMAGVVDTLPEDVMAVFTEFRTAEFATFARDETPVAVEVIPQWQPSAARFLVTSAIGLPNKAYNARRNPKVALLFSDPTGSGLSNPPTVLVQGDAIVSELITWDDELAEYFRCSGSGSRPDGNGARTRSPVGSWTGTTCGQDPHHASSHPVVAGRGHDQGTRGGDPVSSVWDDTVKAIGRFPSAVLTGTDPDGYPVSVRCQPVPADGVLRVQRPAWLTVSPGPASLMSHSHDEQVWKLRGFLARGVLETEGGEGGGLAFRPLRFTWTAGGGLRSTIKLFRGTRRAAAGYLQRRDMARPKVPWEIIKAAKERTP